MHRLLAATSALGSAILSSAAGAMADIRIHSIQGVTEMMHRALFAVTVLGSAILTPTAGSVGASSGDRTHGAALAVLEAGFSGGSTVVTRTPGQGVVIGIAPTGDPEDVRIYPFAIDAQYCSSGWHVLNFNAGDAVEFYESKQALFDFLASSEISYELDGTVLSTERTAIKPMPASLAAFGLVDMYWFGVGTILPPGTLTLGPHELLTTITDPMFGTFQELVQFTVLPC
jgi:hypothetical protein